MECVGRLGNQLFFYAIARKIQINQERLHNQSHEIAFNFKGIFDRKDTGDGWEDSLKYFNTVSYSTENDTWMNIVYDNASSLKQKVYIVEYIAANSIFFDKLKNPIFFLANKFYSATAKIFGIYFYPHEFNKRKHRVRIPCSLKANKNLFIFGQYENSAFFDDIKPELIKEIVPKFPKIDSNSDLYYAIENNNSICISVRRGDFLNNSAMNICSVDYFKDAIKLIKSKVVNPVWVLFSDDIQWVKNNIGVLFDSSDKVMFETGNDPVWEKLRLMYSCKHYIISNSTFSWWAQYLSRNNSDKIVVCPKRWFRDLPYYSLQDDSFIFV